MARFFEVLKYFDKPLWDKGINYSKLLIIEQVFTIKSDHELSKASYDRIIEWPRSFLPEDDKLRLVNQSSGCFYNFIVNC